MTTLVVVVFVATYAGMAAGRFPGLRIDRTGIVMAIAVLLLSGALSLADAGGMIDASTVVLLFALMVISAQFEGSGFYDRCAHAITRARTRPAMLLGATVAISCFLSAVLANDIVVFAMTPLLCTGLVARGCDPRPYLVGLAGGSNAGSAATIIGNPQNILIGQVGALDFWSFLAVNAAPAIFAMIIVFVVIWLVWKQELTASPRISVSTPAPPPIVPRQLIKAGAAVAVMFGLFATPIPRELAALAVAAFLFLSRTTPSRTLLSRVDWNLLILFVGLFIVTGALAQLTEVQLLVREGVVAGFLPDRLVIMAPLALILSNTIGNVPADVLLLALWPAPATGDLYGLALLSTLAGNFLIVGSIANLIVAERAKVAGVHLSFVAFARAGVPMTLISMMAAIVWLWAGGWMPIV
ncbi:MAG: anion transporter [Alphaproteobacteria bacterium]|nr:anion transporter [Alphaproteobacteria bacterium]